MRLARIVTSVLMLAAGLVIVPHPAAACACGAVVSSTSASVSDETALITWDGSTETIDMVLRLRGSAPDAGWIMPTPPGTALSLGDKAVFPKLAAASAPRIERRYRYFPVIGVGMAGAPRAAPVEVAVSQVGPFTVSALSSSDPGAVNDWLAEHGYPTNPALTPTFATYLAKGWSIQAVKLTSPNGRLGGDLDPLRMTFSISAPVYPILLSKHATSTQGVKIYVAAAHRMEIETSPVSGVRSSRVFSGRVPAADLGLAALTGDDVYLTAFRESLTPASISADYTFRQAADDTDYREVVFVTVDRTWVTLLVAGAILSLLIVVAMTLRRRDRAR